MRIHGFVAAVALACVAAPGWSADTLNDATVTNYLRTNAFDANNIEARCQTNDGLGVKFRAAASPGNIPAFLEFLGLPPNAIAQFNGGQFTDAARALGLAMIDACEMAQDAGEPIPPGGDPVIDGVNISDVEFEYYFEPDRRAGSHPLYRRDIAVVELDAFYYDKEFPPRDDDANGAADAGGDAGAADEDDAGEIHRIADLVFRVNNYRYYERPDPDDPHTINKINGSLPCYYVSADGDAVRRYPWERCNGRTKFDLAPDDAMSLAAATQRMVTDFILTMPLASAPLTNEDDDDQDDDRRCFGAECDDAPPRPDEHFDVCCVDYGFLNRIAGFYFTRTAEQCFNSSASSQVRPRAVCYDLQRRGRTPRREIPMICCAYPDIADRIQFERMTPAECTGIPGGRPAMQDRMCRP